MEILCGPSTSFGRPSSASVGDCAWQSIVSRHVSARDSLGDATRAAFEMAYFMMISSLYPGDVGKGPVERFNCNRKMTLPFASTFVDDCGIDLEVKPLRARYSIAALATSPQANRVVNRMPNMRQACACD
jgi:hypothetical protein